MNARNKYQPARRYNQLHTNQSTRVLVYQIVPHSAGDVIRTMSLRPQVHLHPSHTRRERAHGSAILPACFYICLPARLLSFARTRHRETRGGAVRDAHHTPAHGVRVAGGEGAMARRSDSATEGEPLMLQTESHTPCVTPWCRSRNQNTVSRNTAFAGRVIRSTCMATHAS